MTARIAGFVGIALIALGAPATGIASEPLVISQLTVETSRPRAGASFRGAEALTVETRAGGPALTLAPRPSGLALQADYSPMANVTIAGRYLGSHRAFTPPAAGQPGLSLARNDGYAFGLTKGETWLRGDRLSLTVSQPQRFGGGPLGPDQPLAVPSYGFQVQDLGPGAREVMTELRYFTPLWKSSGLGLSLINRVRPNDNAQAPDERIMMMRFSTQF